MDVFVDVDLHMTGVADTGPAPFEYVTVLTYV